MRHVLRAYPTLLRVGLAEVLTYRAALIAWLLTANLPLIMMALWTTVASEGAVAGYDRKQFTMYYLATIVVRTVTSSWLVWELTTDIRQGRLATRLLRPVHPLLTYSAPHLAGVPVRLLIVSPFIALLLWNGGRSLCIFDPGAFALFLIALAGAWILLFLTMLFLGSLAFFVDSAVAPFDLWLAVHFILSGYLVPIDLLPPWVAVLARTLPFRFILGFPVELLIGRLDLHAAVRQLCMQWAYIAFMFVAVAAVWRAAMRRFMAFGG